MDSADCENAFHLLWDTKQRILEIEINQNVKAVFEIMETPHKGKLPVFLQFYKIQKSVISILQACILHIKLILYLFFELCGIFLLCYFHNRQGGRRIIENPFCVLWYEKAGLLEQYDRRIS